MAKRSHKLRGSSRVPVIAEPAAANGAVATRTKVVATIGPERPVYGLDNVLSAENGLYSNLVPALVGAGVDTFRLNDSHRTADGGPEARFLDAFHAARHEWERDGRQVALLVDLQGPKVRLGNVGSDALATAELTPGSLFRIHTREQVDGSPERTTVLYENKPFLGMARQVSPGQAIWLGDGEALLDIVQVDDDGVVVCRVRSGATIRAGRGVTVKGVTFDLECFTAKDQADLRWRLAQCDELAYVALSFVRKAEDILEVRRFIAEHFAAQGLDERTIARRMPWLIAKIETREAVENIDEILDVADGIMVARGDLGMQVGLADLTGIQKRLISKCNVRGKPVITATQMLDSMEDNPIPTRAEATDVHNAILDGTDAVMLSGETSKGAYPLHAVQTMREIVRKAENEYFTQTDPEERFTELLHEAEDELEAAHTRVLARIDSAPDRFTLEEYLRIKRLLATQNMTDAVSCAACNVSAALPVAAIMAPTTSGRTAQMVARFRPNVPVIGAAHDAGTARKLTLCFGVHAINIFDGQRDSETLFRCGCEAAMRTRPLAWSGPVIRPRDTIVITSGFPLHEAGTTNLLKLHRAN